MNKCHSCETEDPSEIIGQDVDDNFVPKWFIIDEVNSDPTHLLINEIGETESMFAMGELDVEITDGQSVICNDCFDKRFPPPKEEEYDEFDS